MNIYAKNIVLSLLCFFFFNTKAQTYYPPLAYAENVSDTQQILNIDFIKSLDPSIRVYLSGENHTYVYYNNQVEVELLKYLHKNKGVRNLVIELGYARGYMLDKYINEDSTVMEVLRFQTSYQYLEFYESLRQFNQTLTDSERIHVFGVDVERFSQDGNMLLHYLLHKKDSIKAPEQIEFFVESIRAYNATPEYTYKNDYYYQDYVEESSLVEKKIVDTLISQYNRQQLAINAYLSSDSIVFSNTIQSLKDFQLYQSYERMPQQYLYRERYLKKQMESLLDKDSTSKYYGQFGRCHIGLKQFENECQWWENSPMARRLNDSKYKNQIYSIGLFYKSSDYEYENDFMNYEVTDYVDDIFDSLKPSSHFLFPLSKNDTLLNEHFNAIILVNTDNVYYKYNETRKDFFSFDINAGQINFNLNSFNSAVFGNSINQFNSSIRTLNFSYLISASRFVQSGEFALIVPQTIQQGKSKFTLGGSMYHLGYGFDPQIGKTFNVIPYALFGYTRLSFTAQNDSLKQSFSNGFSGIDRQKFVNSGFTLGLGGNLKINLTNWFGLNFKAYALADVSNKQWRFKSSGLNSIDKSSPRTSLLNYGFSAGISLLIRD